MASIINRYRPGEKGLQQILGELEGEVMTVVWQKKSCSVRDVLCDLQKEREIAYTTVMTVMSRLHKKGFVQRIKEGQAFVYQPTMTKDELQKEAVKNVLKGIFNNSSEMTMVHFVNEVAKNKKNLEELQKLIEKRLKDE